MRRGSSSNEMQVNVAGLRRNLKNFAHNYSDAQKKVREATSNDPWGPSSTIMAEIADLTYNVVAFSEIMQMVWKRLNDHGRNWRHVHKALVLLEYLIKTGSEKVGQQCKENIFAIQTLKDFQYLEEGKDQGSNVREKAKQLVNLLKDDEKLKNERARALKAKERFAQSVCGFGSDSGLDTPCSPKFPAFRGDWNASAPDGAGRESENVPREIENARPQTAGEEELQLQLALAMSREEAEQEEQKRKSDDVRLQLALSQSQHDFKVPEEKTSHMVDLLDVNLGEVAAPIVDPWGMPQAPRPEQSSPWQSGSLSSPPNSAPADPWLPVQPPPQSLSAPKIDPWVGLRDTTSPPIPTLPDHHQQQLKHDPWSPNNSQSSPDLDDFDVITNRNRNSPIITNGSNSNHHSNNINNNNGTNDPFELNLLGDILPTTISPSTGATKKTPQSFLGENSALVNLDNLVTATKPLNTSLSANPFSDAQLPPQRPIFNHPPPKPTINEIKQASTFAPFSQSTAGGSVGAINSSAAGLSSNPTYFGGGGGSSGAINIQLKQDPWAPMAASSVPSNNTSSWMKATEQANPFLS